MNPLSALLLVVLCVTVLASTRRGALLALLASVLYLHQSQAVTLLSLNLFPTRLVELALFARIVGRREWAFVRLNAIDRAFLLLYVYTTVVFLLRSDDGQAYQTAIAVDACLVYFPCRALIDSPEDFRWVLRSFVLLLIPFVLVVALERVTFHSPLAFMGWGAGTTWVRDNGVRCFGSFRHPSLLGTISVSFIPMFFGMAFRREDRYRAALGIALCLIIVWATNSGGPIGGVAFGCAAWLLWKVRTKMRLVRWGIVAFISLAALLMKAPVWYLIAHVGEFTGGDAWHRAYLLDVSFQHLRQWWLAGMPGTDTADWFPYTLTVTGGADLTNLYISFGITAGLGALALFILLLTRAFSALGNALWAVRAASMQRSEDEFLLWGLGCMLAAHIANWLGITYFDQTYVFWFAQLAAIATLSDWYVKKTSEAGAEIQDEETGSALGEAVEPVAQ